MKLLLWHWGRRGGGVRYTYELAMALKSHCDVELSLSRQSELFDQTVGLGLPGWHVDTYCDLASAMASVTRLPQVRSLFSEFLERRHFDTVIATMHHLWSPALLGAVRRSGARLIFVVHDAYPHPGDSALAWDFMLRRELEGSDSIVTLSEHVAAQLNDRFGVPWDQISVLAHPSFHFVPEARSPRRYPAARPLRLLFFGRIRRYKGLEVLLDAVRQLEAVYPVALTIAGQGSLQPYADRLSKLGSVRLINRWIAEDEVAEILTANDLLIAPYIEASQSGVIPSAYQAGLPVIATPVGGLSEQVVSGDTGLVADAPTVAALVASIERMVIDPVLYERCSAGATEMARSKLSWNKTATGYVDIATSLTRLVPRSSSAREPARSNHPVPGFSGSAGRGPQRPPAWR